MNISAYLKPSKINRQKRRDKRLYEELIECRRANSGKKNKKYKDKGQIRKHQNEARLDSLPQREAYKPKPSLTYSSDNLEPLIRWLQSHTGQDWDTVYAKLSQQLDKRSTLGMHVLDHLWDFVDVHSKLENGVLVHYDTYGRKRIKAPYFFVHPSTGLLESARYELQKGAFPKKARWKKAKQKLKSKIRLGLIKKPAYPAKQYPTYQHGCIQTKDNTVKVGHIYQLRHRDFRATIEILADLSELTRYPNYAYLRFKYRIVDCELAWMIGTVAFLSANYRVEYQNYWRIR